MSTLHALAPTLLVIDPSTHLTDAVVATVIELTELLPISVSLSHVLAYVTKRATANVHPRMSACRRLAPTFAAHDVAILEIHAPAPVSVINTFECAIFELVFEE